MMLVFVVVRTTSHGDGFDIVGAFASHERAQETARVAEKWADTLNVFVRAATYTSNGGPA